MTVPGPREQGARRAAALAALGLVAAAAFALRAVGAESVFLEGGPVVFALGDGPYHARLARFALEHFPAFLTFDPYLNAPHGAPVPWPPLYDLGVAGVTRVLGGGEPTLERVLAWSTPALAAATSLPIYAAARAMGGRGVAVGAAAMHAVFGPSLAYGAVGNGDHHAAVALFTACLLAAALALARDGERTARLLGAGAALAAARAAVLLTWNGSLLLLLVTDGLLVLFLAASARARALRTEAASLAATALATAPGVAAFEVPLGGPWSAVALSRLHLLVLAGAALLAAGLALAEERRPLATPARRVARLTGALAVAGLAALAVPGVRAAVVQALEFVALRDPSGTVIVERLPLLPFGGRRPASPPQSYFGWLTWAVPLAPLLPLWAVRAPRARRPARYLAAWSTPLALLTLTQARYGNELGPALAVCFALGFARAAAVLRERLGLGRVAAAAAASALAAGLLAPAVREGPARGARATLAWWLGTGGPAPGAEALASTPTASLARFALEVRRLTPETGGFVGPGAPDYTVLCNWNIGHALRWYGRRATPVDPFWEIVDPEHFAQVERFFTLEDEAEMRAAARTLAARYLVTSAAAAANFPLEQRLHAGDGLGPGGRLAYTQLRLLSEGPAGGRPFSDAFGIARPAQVIPYKLFEIVEGARLEVAAAPGTEVEATTRITTPIGRGFDVRAVARAGPDGVAHLRLPYATRTTAPAHPLGPWRVRAAGRETTLHLSEEQVRAGTFIEKLSFDDSAPAEKSTSQ